MSSIPVEAWKSQNLPTDLHTQESQGRARSKKWDALKAIVILACGALALRQVSLMIDEYLSFPTNTLYMTDYIGSIPAPAFTICPRPSLKAAFAREWSQNYKKFKDASLSLADFVLQAPASGQKVDLTNVSTVMGETIIPIKDDASYWSERTFAEMQADREYFKCFTLYLDQEIDTGQSTCSNKTFKFDFKAIRDISEDQKKKEVDFFFLKEIQVFVHDQKEKFAYLESFKPEHVLVLNNTVTNIAIRPEFIQKQNKKDDPCTLDEDYSYMRCIENCFWKRAQTSPDLPCLIPSLLPDGANLTKPECQDEKEEDNQQMYISGTGSNISLWSNCSCVKRCKLIDYHLFLNPVNPCEWRAGQGNATGLASLMFSFPSNRMAHILEMEKVTLLDLLSNIGGIVGICLGVSLITIFDLIEKASSSTSCKFLRRRKDAIQSDKQ